jgi:hypothetical protein
MFIAFSSRRLAISVSVCFDDGSTASAEEVHMKIHRTYPLISMPCASAAMDHPALLD